MSGISAASGNFFSRLFSRETLLPSFQYVCLAAITLTAFQASLKSHKAFPSQEFFVLVSIYSIPRLLKSLSSHKHIALKVDALATLFLTYLTWTGGSCIGRSVGGCIVAFHKLLKYRAVFLRMEKGGLFCLQLIAYILLSISALSTGLLFSTLSYRWTRWFATHRTTLITSLQGDRREFSRLLGERLKEDFPLGLGEVLHLWIQDQVGLAALNQLQHIDPEFIQDYSAEQIIELLNYPGLSAESFTAILDRCLMHLDLGFFLARDNESLRIRFVEYLRTKDAQFLESLFEARLSSLPLFMTLEANHAAREQLSIYLNRKLTPPPVSLTADNLEAWKRQLQEYKNIDTQDRSALTAARTAIAQQIRYLSEKNFEQEMRAAMTYLRFIEDISPSQILLNISNEQLASRSRIQHVPALNRAFLEYREALNNFNTVLSHRLEPSEEKKEDLEESSALYLANLGLAAEPCRSFLQTCGLFPKGDKTIWDVLKETLEAKGAGDVEALKTVLKAQRLITDEELEQPGVEHLWEGVKKLIRPPSRWSIQLPSSFHKQLRKVARRIYLCFRLFLTTGLIGLQLYYKPSLFGYGVAAGFLSPDAIGARVDNFYRHFSPFSLSMTFRGTFWGIPMVRSRFVDLLFQAWRRPDSTPSFIHFIGLVGAELDSALQTIETDRTAFPFVTGIFYGSSLSRYFIQQ